MAQRGSENFAINVDLSRKFGFRLGVRVPPAALKHRKKDFVFLKMLYFVHILFKHIQYNGNRNTDNRRNHL